MKGKQLSVSVSQFLLYLLAWLSACLCFGQFKVPATVIDVLLLLHVFRCTDFPPLLPGSFHAFLCLEQCSLLAVTPLFPFSFPTLHSLLTNCVYFALAILFTLALSIKSINAIDLKACTEFICEIVSVALWVHFKSYLMDVERT